MFPILLLLAFVALGGSGRVISHPNPSIIIVGSGPSGIAAATRLLKNNFTNFKILEAENRIGGRVHSIIFGDAYVDLGAEFCHGNTDNIVYSLVKDLDVLRPSNPDDYFIKSNGEVIDKVTAEKIILFKETLEADNATKSQCESVASVGECLNIRSETFINSATTTNEATTLQDSIGWIISDLSSLDSPFDLNDLNITSAYKICDGDLGLNWNGLGFKTVLEVMTQRYPNPKNQLPINDKILLNKEVVNITNWQHNKAVVVTDDGSRYEADHIIFTPSLGVLKANHEKIFSPRLPEEKVKAIQNIGYGAILKIIMHFSEKWWDGNANWCLSWTGEDKLKLKEKQLEWLNALTGIIQGENNSNVLISWFAGKYIPQIETLSHNEIDRGINHLLTSFFSTKHNVKLPDKVIRTSWYSNPHFKGTYSYESAKGFRVAGNKLPDKLAKPLLKLDQTPAVLFAGEATHPYYFSTVHGAIESGYREANRILIFYNLK